jgi:hypothetical protein
MFWEVTRYALLHSFASLCYHRPLSDIERRRFESAIPARGRGGLLSKSVCPLRTRSSETLVITESSFNAGG